MNLTVQNLRKATDVEIVEMVVRGDDRAKRMLVERLFSEVRATIHYLAPNDRDTDDLVQEALIQILRSTDNYRGESRLEVWAYRIVLRTTVRHLNRRRSRFRLFKTEQTPEPRLFETPEHNTERFQLRRRLKGLLDTLPVQQRVTVVLRLVQGLSLHEIADVTEVPLNTARERLRMGRKKLRHAILNDQALAVWLEKM